MHFHTLSRLPVWGGHLLLFLITLLTTTLAGMEWGLGLYFPYDRLPSGQQWMAGLTFSLPFLGILTVHEFGHYFTARYHRLRVSLPYYIPMWFFGWGLSIGTMGAFIRISSFIRTRRQFFDVGASGPLLGFLCILPVLYYGFTHLPPPSHVFDIHPEYRAYGQDYAQHVYASDMDLRMGSNLLMDLFARYVAPDPSWVPNDHEIFHNPWLLAGYLACFFTALNLLPIGQLDGGHVAYALLGRRRARYVAHISFTLFMGYAGLGLFSVSQPWDYLLPYGLLYVGVLYLVYRRNVPSAAWAWGWALGIFSLQMAIVGVWPSVQGYPGWLVFGALLGRVLGLEHPQAYDERPLDGWRKAGALLCLLVFVLCASPAPFLLD